MQCPKCLADLSYDVIVLSVSTITGRARYLEGTCCRDCNEQYIPVNGEAVPVDEYEAMTDAPDSPLTDKDVSRMFEDGI